MWVDWHCPVGCGAARRSDAGTLLVQSARGEGGGEGRGEGGGGRGGRGGEGRGGEERG